jgi:hypothetical protein
LFENYKISSIADLGCGTLGWLYPAIQNFKYYIGIDVVETVIEENRRAHPELAFELYGGSLPKVDLIFCRDCMPHLTHEQIKKILTLIKQSGAEWLLATTYPGATNTVLDKAGGFRPVNLARHPFLMPKQKRLLADQGGKRLGLWRL